MKALRRQREVVHWESARSAGGVRGTGECSGGVGCLICRSGRPVPSTADLLKAWWFSPWPPVHNAHGARCGSSEQRECHVRSRARSYAAPDPDDDSCVPAMSHIRQFATPPSRATVRAGDQASHRTVGYNTRMALPAVLHTPAFDSAVPDQRASMHGLDSWRHQAMLAIRGDHAGCDFRTSRETWRS